MNPIKLYEVNAAIADLIENSIDIETGEIITDSEKLMAQLNELQMEHQSILEYLAKLILNIRAETTAIKGEELRLKTRRERLAKKENHLLDVLDRECCGEKTNLGIATLSYRKTSHVVIFDPEEAVKWLKQNKLENCYRIPEPELAKNEVKKLINSGTTVPGCTVVEEKSCSLK